MTDIADRAEQAEAAQREASLATARRAREAEAARTAAEICVNCGEQIPPARRQYVPGVQYCFECQQVLEQHRQRQRRAA